MVARVRDISFVCSEAEHLAADCVTIGDTRKGGELVRREGVTNAEVQQLIRSAFNTFDGDVDVCFWNASEPKAVRRFMITCQGTQSARVAGPVGGLTGGQVPVSDYLALMRENFQLQRDMDRAAQDAPKTDYLEAAIGAIRDVLVKRGGPVTAPAAARVEGPEPEQDEPDAADLFYEEEPEAERLLQALVRMKRENPKMYETAKAYLK